MNGDLYCWGDNELDGVGDGTTDDQLTPVKIFEDVSDVSISSENIAAIKITEIYTVGDLIDLVKLETERLQTSSLRLEY